jgi:chromosome partitioning protein
MSDIVSFLGQKGGTGKSTLARAYAVEAARTDARVLIADLDDAQRTSFEWGQRRLANKLSPDVDVQLISHLELFAKADTVDLLVVDGPGATDASTEWIAKGSQLIVLPTGPAIDDLNPTVRLGHELKLKNILAWRLAIILTRIHTDAQEEFARKYLRQADYKPLQALLHEHKGFPELQNSGRAITEGPHSAATREARAVVDNISSALHRAHKNQAELDRLAPPMRIVERPDRGDR